MAYTASKAAIAGMCLTMARDMGGLGIRALAIAPTCSPPVRPRVIPDEFAEQLTKDAAFPKRLGRPEEYAKLVQAISRTRCSTASASGSTPASASHPSSCGSRDW